jgi:hypothetical protein
MRAPCNVGLVARIDAPVDRERFAGAMTWLPRRYPLLTATIEVSGGEPRFVEREGGKIAFDWRPRASADAWRGVGAKELGTGFGDGPLMRFTVLAGEQATDILMSISHILCDGLSMAQVMSDLLRVIDDPSLPAVPVVDRGTIDDRTPAAIRERWLPFARHVLEQVTQAPHDSARNARLAAGYRGRTNFDWVTLTLEPEQTERLRKVSRDHGTTVQGALTAALSLAVGERAERQGRKKIAVHSPINLRKHMDPQVVDEIGNFAAGTTTWVPCRQDFWETARHIKGDIERALARGAPFANERLGRGAKRATPRTKPRWLALRLWPDFGVTNLGLFAAPETDLGRALREMHVIVALPVMETFVCGTVTVHGRLFCDVMFCPDDVPRSEIDALAASARAHLASVLA